LGAVTGEIIDGPVPDDGLVVVAVDGTIVGVSPVYEFSDTEGSFAALLATGTLRAGETHEVRLGLIDGDDAVELELER